MKITEQIIRSELKNFCIPQGECGRKAFEIASILFNKKIGVFDPKRCKSLDDVLLEISNALINEKIVIIWLDTGPKNPQNFNYRALHCYFVFEDSPLRSFSIWNTPGPEFYDCAYTRTKIDETIKLFLDDGIGLHVVPRSLI